MKRKIDQNQPPQRNSIPWRMMLGAVVLCFMTSVNSFGQTALSLAEVQDLQQQINKVEYKLSFPMVANDPVNGVEMQNLLAELQEKLANQLDLMGQKNPKDLELFNAWTAQTDAAQVIDQNLVEQTPAYKTALNSYLQDQAFTGQLNTGMPTATQGNGIIPPSGTTSFDPNKIPNP